MGLREKWLRRYRDDWCRDCRREMEQTCERLYAMPRVSVGHYVEHTDPEFYEENLCPVDAKSDIPPGMYACGAIQYRCPGCGKRTTVLSPFLPVREAAKRERSMVFRGGELDDFLWK